MLSLGAKKSYPFVLTDIQLSLGRQLQTISQWTHQYIFFKWCEAHRCMMGSFTLKQETPAGGHVGGLEFVCWSLQFKIIK